MTSFSLSAARARVSDLFPGVLLALTVAGAAKFLSEHYGAPVMLFALLIGMAFNFLSQDGRCKPGIEFASRTLLRAGIVLLGARITFGDIASIGVSGLVTVVSLIALTIASGFVCARLFSRGWRFALLTGGSVAICGASAALAIASVIPHNDKTERNLLFTVVAVTTLSTVAMIVYPVLFSLIGFTDIQSGFLIGATVHDVAQVVGAGYSISTEAGDMATIVKLLRVAMLPVVLLIIALALSSREGAGGKIRLPAFVIGFVAVAAANSFHVIPQGLAGGAVSLSSWLLVTAIAALGVKTNMKAMLDLGWRHSAVVVAETLLLLTMALTALESGLLPG
ncbi:MAG: putative sulfate exporter family transporter [Zhengella sp.]|uniref:YeiH family protein n=1 Tax=Zhengella sp. TaxID=2282762 RepID=UPI001DC3DB08|nr:putative sulfate exporter family transporter [Notoacmeibacter sp.]